tara:strand:- start:186 stop:722 length:537 start_codon:yes stop_codon:yes gene_type:complete
MKKIILIFLMLSFSIKSIAQNQLITLGTEPALLVRGAYEGDSDSFAANFFFSMETETKNGNRVGAFVNYVELEPYYFASGITYSKLMTRKISDVNFFYGGEVFTLVRGFRAPDKSFFVTGAVFLKGTFLMIENFELGFVSKLTYRADIEEHYKNYKPFDDKKSLKQSFSSTVQAIFRF